MGFSFSRLYAILVKEFIQMRRDRGTFAVMVGVPVLQLLLFGFAINTDPKHLPTAIHIADDSRFARSIGAALKNSDYFDIIAVASSQQEGDRMLDEGDVSFVITIPVNFARDLVRGLSPEMLIQADASDPSAASNALAAMSQLATSALKDDLVGPLAIRATTPPFTPVIQRRYNPEGITAYNIVPGLIATILTMTMVMVTAVAMTRERERGTYENLLAMPAHRFEVMLGKIIPYVAVGYIQLALILLGARFIFNVPMIGSLTLLVGAAGIFIAANLALGFTFSTIAKTQLQAMQTAVFFLLPSILLSGFAFPFRGMPDWAQWVGELLPATYFLRIVRGILLKGNGWAEIWPDIWPLFVFLGVVGAVALLRYRRTLD
ncbi:MAG TPA: ABC transporter permease [Micropepsaceae bacterium]|jgi:ABC-2 type transport system permease protein|nr:ABC transporter permease [Micropepsaceae bacterium]